MSESTKAVFLSYASQDSEAAKRICEALRQAGVEVWFDQNELVGGDAWDQKIRKQIRDCALLVPVISQTTQARREAYFRLEWKLADERTHLMAKGTPYLLPITIDDTSDRDAIVPDSFLAVQWTKAPGGELPVAFGARVKRLLDGNGAGVDAARADRPLVATAPATASRSRWLIPVIAAGAIIVAGTWGLLRRPGLPAPVSPVALPAVAPKSVARDMVDRAMVLSEASQPDSAGLIAAADLAEKAAQLDSTDGDVWAIAGLVDIRCWVHTADRTSRRQELARTKITRAKALAPRSALVRFAEARMFIELGLYPDGGSRAEPILRELLQEASPELTRTELLGMLGLALSKQGRKEEAAKFLAEAAQAEPGWQNAASWMYLEMGRYPEALAAARAQAKLDPVASLQQQMYVQIVRGDLDAVDEALGQLPAAAKLLDGPAASEVVAAYCRRDAARLLTALQVMPGDIMQTTWLRGPKAFYAGFAHRMAGREAAAQLQWREALALIDQTLAASRSDQSVQRKRLQLLALLGRREEAAQVYLLLHQLYGGKDYPAESEDLVFLGRHEEALATLATVLRQGSAMTLHAYARYSITFDPLRGDPRFEKLLRDTLPPGAKPFDNAQGRPFDEPKPAVAPIPAADEKSLVVLPLENLSPDPDNAFFTEGMHAEIIATLQRTTDLRVIGRDSALALKRGSGSLAELAARVGAANVMTGSVRRSGTKVLILLELRRARDEALLWASPNTVRELGADIFGLQAEVAREVVRVLQARERKGWSADAEFRTSNAQALDLFLKAQQIFRSYFTTTSESRMPAAIALMEEALRLDPHFVSAMQLLSVARVDRYRSSLDLRQRAVHAAEGKRWAEAAAREVSGGAGDSALYFYCLWVENDPVRALALNDNFIRAVPNDASGWNGRGLIMTQLGRYEEAIASYERSILLDPLWVVARTNKYLMLARHRHRVEAEAMLPEILPLLDDRTRPTDAMIQARFYLTGESAPVDHLSIRRQVAWLALFRKPAEQLALVERELATPNLDEGTEFYWRRYQCDALVRLGRAAEVEQPAHRMLVLAEEIGGMPEVDPVDKQRRMAQALLATRQMKEAAAAAQRAIEIDRRRGVMSQLWTDQVMLAEIYAQAAKKAECFTLLRALLQVPSGLTVPILRVAPMWDPVRDDPEFQALLNDPKNNAPLL